MREKVKIFLSYAREDKERVEALYKQLLDAGYKPWMDSQDILVGENWLKSIDKAIPESHFFLVCLSHVSIDKRGEFQNEIKIALAAKKRLKENDIYLLPVRLDDAPVPEELREYQWVDMFEDDFWVRLTDAFREGMKRRKAKSISIIKTNSQGTNKLSQSNIRPLSINQIPSKILGQLKSDQVLLITSETLGNKVLGSTTFNPYALEIVKGLEELVKLREIAKVYSIVLSILELKQHAISEATFGFDNRFLIMHELDSLLAYYKKVYVIYVATHFSYNPLGELTVSIGGDFYRAGPEIGNLESALLKSTRDLALAMIRKAVMIFPDIPALHGGKKGEWLILDRDGRKIEGLSEDAIIALGTLIIPKGIKFLNEYKEKTAKEKGIIDSFSTRNIIYPDSISPDVMSGPNWLSMCEVWAKRGLDLSMVTCLPASLGGPIMPSSFPTGYGVVATAIKLVEYFFKNRNLGDIHFLLEGLGGVGQATIEALLMKGCQPGNITAFDRWAETCRRASDKYGINTFSMNHQEFYLRLNSRQHFDVWINNGEGDNTLPQHIEQLLRSGIKIFCGAALNLFKYSSEKESLQKIFEAGAWAWPDEAASGGGWTLAALDLMTRAKGEQSNTPELKHKILNTITSRNEKLVDDVVGYLVMKNREATGRAIWEMVGQVVDQRVMSTLNKTLTSKEILMHANVGNWQVL
jgi:hypothetical protein